FEDEDGCPELDNDKDGIADAQDKCPTEPEDKDGFEDDDGCPDPDNDHDGIPDAADKCPLQPETVNGVADEDGCPDTGGVELVKLDGDRLEVGKVPALAGTSLSAAGLIIVNEMALVMLAHPEVTSWLVAIAQPNVKDAQKLGDAIRARLAQRGLANVQVLAAAGIAKIGAVVQERAEPATLPSCGKNDEKVDLDLSR
ncbi:MAG: thrombospondin type 3 repeat-containing protein, partial [Kofleriaceae bacterium]